MKGHFRVSLIWVFAFLGGHLKQQQPQGLPDTGRALVKIKTIKRKIAIAGTTRSGKTVFLTSLLNHLYEHNPKVFPIDDDGTVRISDVRALPVSKRIGSKFNFDGYRDALVYHGKWPKKTRDTSHFIVSFRRSDWNFSRNQLHFFDLPGERIADASISKHDNYEDWSDEVINHIASSTPYRELATEFFSSLDRSDLTAESLVAAYRLAMARFYINFKTMITPSTFILDQNGGMPRSRTKDDFLEEQRERFSGLSPDSETGHDRQFAPMSEKARNTNPELVKTLSKNYDLYRKQVVLPVFNQIQSSKRLIVLIDIPSLLNGGVDLYNDNRQILIDLFDVLRPGSFLSRIFPGRKLLDRVAFVATKCDIVHPNDVENDRLFNLLKEMTHRFAYQIEEIRFEQFRWFTASAMVSAKPAEGEQEMRAVMTHNNPEGEEKIFKVSSLPEKWPSSWKYGDFSFHSVMPRMPENKALSPEHHNLNRIFEFITKD